MRERVRVPELLAARARGDYDVEDRFFTQLQLRNGVYKMTERHRFDDTLDATVAHANRIGARRVLDVACSSGISTLELATALCTREVHGTDLTIDATYLERDGFGWLVDANDRVLQVDHPQWAMPWSPGKRELALHPIRVAHSLLLRAVRRSLRSFAHTQVSLISSQVAATSVQIHEEDARKPTVPGLFELVRVANFMNVFYFSRRQLLALRDAVVSRIADGGVLFIVRTHHDRSNHGSYFERRGSRMVELDRVGAGSEVRELITR